MYSSKISISLCITRQNMHVESISACTFYSVFKSEIVFNNHKENCTLINGAQVIKMSKADDIVYFKNHHKGLEVPFIIYTDFEAINEKVHGCKPNNDK